MGHHGKPAAFRAAPSLRACRLPGGVLDTAEVQTAEGYVCAGDIRVGMRIVTQDGLVPVAGIVRLPAARTALVRIRAGSDLLPYAAEDLVVAADQAVWLTGRTAFSHTGRSEAAVPAGRLADGIDVLRTVLPEASDHRVIRLVFAGPEVVFAGGAELSVAAEAGIRRRVPA